MRKGKKFIIIGLLAVSAITAFILTTNKGDRETLINESKEKVEEMTARENDSKIDRKINVEGLHNMRDLGGYESSDGRTVKFGKIYRSENLNGLTDNGLIDFEKLDIKTVVDFRGENEIEQHPDKLPENTNSVNLPVSDPADLGELIPAELQKEIRGALIDRNFDKAKELLEKNNIDLKKLKEDRYVQFPSIWNEEFSSFLKEVIKNDGEPVLFHCEGGKDRAGFAAAMLLRTLDVSVEDVMYDFLLTNEYNNVKNEELMKLWPEELHPVLIADKEDLQAALNYIDENYENFDNYRREVLKITDQEKDKLKELLLK